MKRPFAGISTEQFDWTMKTNTFLDYQSCLAVHGASQLFSKRLCRRANRPERSQSVRERSML
jgi:hypothetical protein